MPDTVKQAVLTMIGDLPDNVSLEEIMAELYFRQKVDTGLHQLDSGERIEHEDAKHRLNQWLS